MIVKRSANINVVILYRLLVVFVLYTLCRLLFLGFHFESFKPLDAGIVTTLLRGGIRFDAAAIMYLNLPVILMLVIPFKFRHNSVYQRVAWYLFVILNLVGLALNVADIGYYPYTKTRTTASIFVQFSEEANKLTLFGQFLIDYWHLLLIYIALAIAFIYSSSRFQVSEVRIKHRLLYFFGSFAMMLFYVFIVVFSIRGTLRFGAKPIYLNEAAEYTVAPSQVQLVLSTPFSVIRTIGRKSYEKRHYFDDPNLLAQWMNPIHRPDSGAVFKPHNVVVVILEGIGREYIGAVNQLAGGEALQTYTPFLDSLFREGLVYQNAFANGRRSVEAPPAIFASIPSMGVSYTLSQNANNNIKTMAHCLKEKGYYSAFYHGAANGSMHFDTFMKLAGFDAYFGRDEYNNEAHYDGMWGIWDEEYLQYFAAQMDSMPQPFLSSVFTLTSHHPYSVPDRYKDKLPAGNLPMHRCVAYTDNALRQFFSKARKSSWYNNTLFVITADHASIPYYDDYKTLAGEFAIPLFFYMPGGNLGGVNNESMANQIDIMPTVLDILGYDKPYFAYGKSLIDTPNDRNFAVSANGERIQVYHRQLMVVREHDRILQWFDLNKGYQAPKTPFLPAETERDSLNTFGKAFEQQFYNRVLANKTIVE